MIRPLARLHLAGLIVLALGLAAPHFYGQSTEAPVKAPPKELHVYLLLGQSNMAGRAAIPQDADGLIDRCYLLNPENEWEPARNPLNRHSSIGKSPEMQKLGPGYAFARKMLEENNDVSIGLIVNARGGTNIDEWLGKSKLYWGARGRTRAALKKNDPKAVLKGVLWHQGESDKKASAEYLEKLRSFIANLRSDLGDPNLPFIAGEIADGPEFNRSIAALPKEIHNTGVVSAEGLGTTDGTHFDTKSQLTLGERYAREMIRVQVTLAQNQPAPPQDIKFHIDQNKNMVEPGMARVDRVLKMFPECKVVAHAYWWRQLQSGACDRQLQEHPNLYADMSGHVVVNLLNRDRKYAREFLIRNQDKILWATDEGWWSFGSKDKQMNLHYTFFEELDLPKEVREKIYRGNAEKVYGLK